MEHNFEGVVVILYKPELSTNIVMGLSNEAAITCLETMKHKLLHQMHVSTTPTLDEEVLAS